GGGGSNDNSRVSTTRDLLATFPGYRPYANPGLSNFVWSQAVQNKPPNEGLGIDNEPREMK
ncbi:unnamed protein product, partial [Arabidopsis halleri]